MAKETKRHRWELLRSQLDNERTSFMSHWRDLADFVFPRRPRFSITDANRGDRKNTKIIDSTATMAARTLRSGMMSGITSPARPWFRLTTPDPDLAEFANVKDWLHLVTNRMTTVFLRSNLYNSLPIIYGDLGVFGSAAMLIEEDFKEVIRTYPFPIGSYYLATNAKLKVDVFIREFRMTVRQLVNEFGRVKEQGEQYGSIDWPRFSDHIKNLWEAGTTEAWIDICHVIEPNEDYDPKKTGSEFKKYISAYYESGSTTNQNANYLNNDYDRYLRMSGYDYFPVLAPRWEISGEDVYGTECPGMIALGDIKQLQLGEKRGAQAIEKMVNPPMVGPPHLKNQKASILPGDITYIDDRGGAQSFRPAHEVNPRIAELEGKQAQIRQRISRVFYEDLFLMLANTDRRQITAREIEERHEEKLLALGPVLEQLNQDVLDPLIDNTFDIMIRQGMVPQPPDELQGVKLKVEYISIMAQAQKLIGIGGVERFASFANQVATVMPETIDKIDADQMIDVYADLTSVPPSIVRTDDDVAAIRAKRQKAQQIQATAEIIQQGASAARDLASSDMAGDNALTRMLQAGQAGQLAPQ